MPTPKRKLIPGEVYHVYNRGAGKKTIFHSDRDYNRFLLKMVEYKQKFPIAILAYCLMPNHFHFLVRVVGGATPRVETKSTPRVEIPSQIFLHRLFTSYGKYYDCKYENHSGRVFQGAYRAKHVADAAYHLKLCGYIHDNPVRKELAEQPEEWPFSSYLALIGACEDSISDGAPGLRNVDHRQIYREFAKNRQDIFDDIMKYI